jgi:hypothetical protein
MRYLLDAGITNEYTSCLSSDIGFSQCIATPYPWFDLERNEMTSLTRHPAMTMDVVLKNKLGLDPQYAFNKILDLINITAGVGGTFVLIWHNSSLGTFNDWDRWNGVFRRIVEHLQKLIDEQHAGTDSPK